MLNTPSVRKSSKEHPRPWPQVITNQIGTDRFEVCIFCLILINLVLIVYETDARASGDPEEWLSHLAILFTVIYVVEISLRIYIDRLRYFLVCMNLVDFIIVALDVTSLVLQWSSDIGEQPPYVVLRIFRVLRLLRIIRVSEYFHELWLMLHGLASAMKAMFWAVVLIMIFLLIWSVVAVEILHPLVQELAEEEVYTDCGSFCVDAFVSVRSSMRTWFLLIFVGEMWMDLANPLLRHATASVIFTTAYVMINLGLLNLILTVIVDRASCAREHDQEQKVLEKQEECRRARNRLMALCEELDTDKSQALTVEELEYGFENIPEFANAMEIMDVGKDDLKVVFEILDTDRSGTVSYSEFVEQLHKMRSHESHTLLVFVKHYVHEVHRKVTEQLDLIKNDLLVKTAELFGQYEHQEAGIKRLMSMTMRVGSTAAQKTLVEEPKKEATPKAVISTEPIPI